MDTKNSEFVKGVRDTLPLAVGAIPAGIIFGALSCRAGLSANCTMGMSLMVFNWPSQFIAIGLVAAGTAWPIIVLTTFVANLRLLLYSATLLPYIQKLPRYWRAFLGTGITDPVFWCRWVIGAKKAIAPASTGTNSVQWCSCTRSGTYAQRSVL